MLAQNRLAATQIAGSRRLATAVFAGALGIFFLYFAAFSNSALLHNAAHDTRHAIAAPCH
ncbi:MAG: CbtB domain-containing protein [Pseudomonadota bacterium]|nr:CbtB domain-containing protein [Pseudomonadota bacterium]